MLSAKALLCGLVVLMVALLTPSPARAALPIEFEFTGVYTQTTGTVYSPGDTFTTTMRFDPSAPDLVASPATGHYTYQSWTAPRPTGGNFNFNIITPLNDGIIVDLVEDPPLNQWRLRYAGGIPGFGYEILINFQAGTFADDKLPTNLPFSSAIFTRFEGSDGPRSFSGQLTGFTAREIPEPAGSALALGFLSLAFCRLKRAKLFH